MVLNIMVLTMDCLIKKASVILHGPNFTKDINVD